MIVSGLVVYLDADPARRAAAHRALGGVGGLEVGVAEDPRRLPAVLEAEDGRASERMVRRLAGVDGVERVEVAFVGLDGAAERTRNERDEDEEDGTRST